MYSYLIGTVTGMESNYIVLEVGGIGYVIYTSNPYTFELGQTVKVYVYQLVKEDELSLFGFQTEEEKALFLKLISVKGLGCKMALPMVAGSSVTGVIDAIERENILYLKKFPKIGEKVARQIILDLKGKLVSNEEYINKGNFDELQEVLLGLGYKQKDISRITPKISSELDIEDQVKEALKLLLK